MWLPALRSFGGELFYHNFSRLDSPEIKSASWTARGGANIPVHFFIDLHSFPPLHQTRPTPTRRCLLLFPSCLRCPDLQWSPGLRLMMSCAVFIFSAFEISGEEEEWGRRRGGRTWTRPEMAGGKREHVHAMLTQIWICQAICERIFNVWIIQKEEKKKLIWFGTNDQIVSIGDYVKIKASVSKVACGCVYCARPCTPRPGMAICSWMLSHTQTDSERLHH